jgi:four helix bundle protein
VISRGSVFECVAIFDYLKDLNQIDKTSFEKYYSYLEEISKMLLALIKHFEK